MAVEPRENWMVMLLQDLRDVARRDCMQASADALTVAIDAVRLEAAPVGGTTAPDRPIRQRLQ